MSTGIKGKIPYTLAVNLFAVLTSCFFVCMEVYMRNYNDFTFPFSQTWWIVLSFSLTIVIIMTAVECFLPESIIEWINYIVFGVGLCFYLQSMFLNGSMSVLDGTEEAFPFQLKLVNILVWLAILISICLVLLSIKKNGNVKVRNVMIFLSAAFIFVQTAGFISNYFALPDADYENAGYLSDEKEFELSSENNVIVFILDACSEQLVQDALQEDPSMFDNLDGFVHYPDSISTFSRTYPSLPYLLTGQFCYYDEPFAQYLTKAYDNSTFMSDIKSTGADLRVFTEPSYIDGAAKEQIDNYKSFNGKAFEIFRPAKLFNMMLHISGYRGMPYLFKDRFAYNVIIVNYLARKLPSDVAIEFQDVDFFNALKENGISVSNSYNEAFRLYHLWGPHPGCFLNENAEWEPDATQVQAVRGSIKIIDDYLERMKTAGIYDNSTIIIMADHGNPYGSDKLEITEPKTCIMMVKEPHSKGSVITSELPVSHENYFATVLSAFGIQDDFFSEPEVYNVSINDRNSRYYYYSARYSDGDGEVALREYRVDGDAGKFENWKLTGDYLDIEFGQAGISKIRLDDVVRMDSGDHIIKREPRFKN